MAKNLLTDLKVKTLKPDAKERFIPDGDRLYLRVRETGNKDWYFIYSSDNKRPKIAIGKYPLTSLEEAREKADLFRKLLNNGINPKDYLAKEKQNLEINKKNEETALQAKLNRLNVDDLFIRWDRLVLKHRKDNGKEVRRMFLKDISPQIGMMPVEEVEKSHIVSLLNKVLERDANRMAKIILSITRQLFNFAIDQDIIETEPTSGIKKSRIGGKDVIRDRVLSENEIKELSDKIKIAKLLTSSECAIWIMLSTLSRISELCKAEWQHLDLEAKKWVIPKENSKNGKAHTIYLSDFSLNQFKRLAEIKTSERWIYPNTKNTCHIDVKSISKQIGDRQLTTERKAMSGRTSLKDSLRLSGGKWTPHDLRRTGATMMGNLGELSDVIEKCLNHIDKSRMVKTYQHQKLIPEQIAAWQSLGKRLSTILNSDLNNIVFLQNQK